jgi:hypothetical protein
MSDIVLFRLTFPADSPPAAPRRGRPVNPFRYFLHCKSTGATVEFDSPAKVMEPFAVLQRFINAGCAIGLDPATWATEVVPVLERNQVNLIPMKTTNREAILEFARANDYALIRRHLDGSGIRTGSFTLDLTEHPPETIEASVPAVAL